MKHLPFPCAAMLLLIAPLLAGCIVPVSVTPTLCREIHAHDGLQIRMMFGLSRPDGSLIGNDDWQRFLNTEITPHFPAGLSVTEALGQWYDPKANKVIQEPSRIVWLILPYDTPSLQHNLKAVRRAYQQQFNQQAVGLSIQSGCSSFESVSAQ